ncbi:MAG: hypothetical protein AB1488_12120 [Nitrospirota bacterium]
MRNIAMLLIGLSALGFVLALISVLVVGDPIVGVTAEGFSRGCTNLALIAIALGVWFRGGAKEA